ncbi:hypothetical protein BDV95DRAFT_611744 [Massariosphaeria phaeospora]|uniref:Uncharacterized protein n=1 Tax=Massariosphaeria phaeospora TaxID=100035 RepID=A0A7C8M0N9_9PLEO|nr:hypothetical protein BDV95DRAFT_611744 [Massariosphaeria phaeospora]
MAGQSAAAFSTTASGRPRLLSAQATTVPTSTSPSEDEESQSSSERSNSSQTSTGVGNELLEKYEESEHQHEELSDATEDEMSEEVEDDQEEDDASEEADDEEGMITYDPNRPGTGPGKDMGRLNAYLAQRTLDRGSDGPTPDAANDDISDDDISDDEDQQSAEDVAGEDAVEEEDDESPEPEVKKQPKYTKSAPSLDRVWSVDTWLSKGNKLQMLQMLKDARKAGVLVAHTGQEKGVELARLANKAQAEYHDKTKGDSPTSKKRRGKAKDDDHPVASGSTATTSATSKKRSRDADDEDDDTEQEARPAKQAKTQSTANGIKKKAVSETSASDEESTNSKGKSKVPKGWFQASAKLKAIFGAARNDLEQEERSKENEDQEMSDAEDAGPGGQSEFEPEEEVFRATFIPMTILTDGTKPIITHRAHVSVRNIVRKTCELEDAGITAQQRKKLVTEIKEARARLITDVSWEILLEDRGEKREHAAALVEQVLGALPDVM